MSGYRDYEFSESTCFRFLCLTDAQAAELSKGISGAECRKSKDNSFNVGVVELREEVIGLIINFYRLHGVARNDCDIFLSLTTESDSEIWEAPTLVNEILRSVDCRLTFSFTCI
jgi:hypothetical protein